ncbi:hypothetical protein N7509_011585, partial [Penicillium cosmopolitanum]
GKQIDSQREPDASSKHRRARYPGVIIEVCYSQKGRCVSHLADEYILNTDGSVNAVVALDIDYKGPKKATSTVWRPEYATLDGKEELQATATIEALPFRTDCGLPIEETALRLSLRDFATQELSQGLTSLNQDFSITSTQLCDFLSRAKEEQPGQMLLQGSINRLRPGAGKRRRPQTPPEQPSSEDEG